MSDIKIVVGADVAQATSGLRAVQGELGKTATIAKTATGAFSSIGSSISSLGSSLISGGIVTGIAIIGAGLVKLVQSFFSATEEAKRLQAANIEIGKSFIKAAEQAGEEIAKVTVLKTVLESENATRLQKITALNQLKKINPDYFGQLDIEDGKVTGLTAAYDGYIQRLLRSINAKANVELLTEAFKDQARAIAQANQNITAGQEKFRAGYLTQFQIMDAIRRFGLTFGAKNGETVLLDFKQEQLIADLLNAEDRIKIITNQISQNITDAFTPKPDKIEAAKKAQAELINTDHFTKFLGLDNKLTAGSLTIKPKVLIQPDIKFAPIGEDILNKMEDWFSKERLMQFQETVTERIRQTYINIIEDSISSVTDSVADSLISGESLLPNLFGGLMKGIGSQVKELGKFLVKTGVEMLAAKKAIKALGLTPQGAIIAGVALQLLGSLLTAAALKKTNSTGFATGVRNFGGGFATVGERGPERVFLPRGSSVQPNNEMSAYGGGQMIFIPDVRLQGADLVIAFNRASQQMGRNN